MESALNNLIYSLENSLLEFKKIVSNRLNSNSYDSFDLYFHKLKEIESINQRQGKELTGFSENKNERLLLNDVLKVSGSRFVSQDDKRYLSKRGLEYFSKNPFPNQELLTAYNYPRLYNIVKEISVEIKDSMPPVIVFDTSANIRSSAISIRNGRFLGFSRELVDLLNDNELRYIVGHEYSHFFDSMMNEKRLCKVSQVFIAEVEREIALNGLNYQSVSFVFSIISQFKEMWDKGEYPAMSKINVNEFDDEKFMNLAKNIKSTCNLLPLVIESSEKNKIDEYVADAFGSYFSGSEAAISGLRKMIFLAYEGKNEIQADQPKKYKNIVREIVQNLSKAKWEQYKTKFSTHPSVEDRVKALQRGSFTDSVVNRLEERLLNSDDFER